MSELKYKNRIGEIFNNKFCIGTDYFFFNDFVSISLVKYYNKKNNYLSLIFSTICLFIFFILRDIVSLVLSCVFIILFIYYKEKKYFILIQDSLVSKNIKINIDKEYKDDAKDFVETVRDIKAINKTLKSLKS